MKPGVLAFLLLSIAFVAQDARGSDAPERASGRLEISVDGSALSLQLELPGAEILDANSEVDDQSQVSNAISDLSEPLELFVPPEAAACVTASANVALVGDGFGQLSAGASQTSDGGAETRELHAHYLIQCQNAEALAHLDLLYFERFENTASLTVTLRASQGDRVIEVERSTPLLRLDGLF